MFNFATVFRDVDVNCESPLEKAIITWCNASSSILLNRCVIFGFEISNRHRRSYDDYH